MQDSTIHKLLTNFVQLLILDQANQSVVSSRQISKHLKKQGYSVPSKNLTQQFHFLEKNELITLTTKDSEIKSKDYNITAKGLIILGEAKAYAKLISSELN